MNKPLSMIGLWATLSDDQKKKALEYRGEENFGDPAYRTLDQALYLVACARVRHQIWKAHANWDEYAGLDDTLENAQ